MAEMDVNEVLRHLPQRPADHRAEMSLEVHPTAQVARGAQLADGVTVGAFSVIGPQVEVGEGTWIGAHVVLDGRMRIGQANKIFHFASLGAPPQDKKYKG